MSHFEEILLILIKPCINKRDFELNLDQGLFWIM